MYDAVILPLAKEDIREAAHWYNDKKRGLGLRFTAQVREQIIFIRKHPGIFAIRYRQIRTAVLNKFPYMIHYQVNEDEKKTVIHAVIHISRNPDFWEKR